MAYRIGTYISFDGLDKTCAVRNTSPRTTRESKIRKRLANSKNVVVVLSGGTRKSGSMLPYEVEQKVDRYDLPRIITYVDYRVVANPSSLSANWLNALNMRITNNSVKAIYIPFTKNALLDAINQFSVNEQKQLSGSINYYSEQAHRIFWAFQFVGLLGSIGFFVNTRK